MTAQELLDVIKAAAADGTLQFEPLSPAEDIGGSTQGPFDMQVTASFYDGSAVIDLGGRQVVNLAILLTPDA